jgi:hypothetical protein
MRNTTYLHAATLVALISAPALFGQQAAPSIILESSNNGVYDYSLDAPSGSQFDIQNNETMALSGLSGVTDATLSGAFDSLCGQSGLSTSFTSTTVTITNDSGNQCFYGPAGGPTTAYANLEVDSSVTTLGTVNYSIEHPDGAFSGTVQGPVSSSPEPTSVVLLLTGIAVLAIRHRLRAA